MVPPLAPLLLAACLVRAPTTGGDDCASCHSIDGSEGVFRAPGGATDPAWMGVGSHLTHLEGGMKSVGMDCDACHPVPDRVDAPGHLDGLATVAWGEVASTAGVAEPYEGGGTCTVWCHGAGLEGGFLGPPTWNVVDGSQVACGACHGLPPPEPHVDDPACETCHDASIVRVDGEPIVAVPELHMNGSIDLHPE